MATPRKGKATKKAPARKTRKTTGSTAVRKMSTGSSTAIRNTGTGNSTAIRNTGTGGSTAPREKLKAVRPSGGKDDSFFDLVYQVVRQIPKGRVTSFGAIGAALGTRSSARMVGWAMNACHLSPQPVPAHRVVNSIGLLTGRHHFKPPERMQQLLEKEGIVVENNKVVEFKRLFWDPSKEL